MEETKIQAEHLALEHEKKTTTRIESEKKDAANAEKKQLIADMTRASERKQEELRKQNELLDMIKKERKDDEDARYQLAYESYILAIQANEKQPVQKRKAKLSHTPFARIYATAATETFQKVSHFMK